MTDLQPDKFKFSFRIRGLDPITLDNAPDGWLNTKITYKVDSLYKALRRSLTLPLKFVLKASFLLRNEFYRYGVLSNVVFEIDKLIPSTYQYEKIYSGKLDFSKAVDGQADFTTDSISNDFTVQLDAFGETKFAFPLTGSDVVEVELPTLNLQEVCDFIMNTSPDFRSDAYFAMQIENYQQNASLPSVYGTGFFADTAPVFDKNNTRYFFLARTNTKIRLYGNMNTSVGSGHYQFNIYKSDGTLVRTLSETNFSVTTENSFSWDFVIDVVNDDRLFFYIKNLTDGNTFRGVNMQNGVFSLQYDTGTPPTKCLGLRAYDLFQRLLQAMNVVNPYEVPLPVPNQSYLLNKALGAFFGRLVYTCSDTVRAYFVDSNGNPTNTIVGTLYQPGDTLQPYGSYVVLGQDPAGSSSDVHVVYNSKTYNVGQTFDWYLGQDTFTSPDGNGFVRQIKSTPAIIISFKDFFQDILSLQGGQAAFGIYNGIAYLEDLAFFYRAGSGGLDVGKVDTKTKITPATDRMFNSIKAGYKDQQYDTINGYNEVNSEVIYVTDLLQPATQADFQAVSRADPYGIEITRVTPLDTSSSRSDNNNFLIMIEPNAQEDGSFLPSRVTDALTFSGVDASYYNWEITPKRNLLRGSRFLRSVFAGLDGYQIRVSAQRKSTALITTDQNGVYVNEAQTETISGAFGTRIFLPFYAQVNAGLPINALDIIDGTPFSDIKFTWNDNQVAGFPVEMNIDTGENSPQSFKLLLSPSNNILNLIR